jgi:hypothetical protein
MLEITELRTLASTLGLEVSTSEIRRSEDIPLAFEPLKGSSIQF